MSFTLASSNAIVRKAGENANSDITGSLALLINYCDQAESEFCAKTRYDWVTNYASVGTNFKPVIEKAVASLAAMEIIKDDMSGFTSRFEAQTMLDVMRDVVTTIITDIKEKHVQDVMI